MRVLIRRRGERLDVTEEVVSPHDTFSVAIRVCCQQSLKEVHNMKGDFLGYIDSVPLVHCSQMQNVATAHVPELKISRGQEPVRWQCPHCLTTVSLSVLD